MIQIEIDPERCDGCGICADFCPVSVFDMATVNGRSLPVASRAADCWACDTCAGQCPADALRVVQPVSRAIGATQAQSQLSSPERNQYKEWCECLKDILQLRWTPVAISLIPAGVPLPHCPKPSGKLRYCQSLMAARQGKSLLMTPDCHACPDGTSILGLTEIPPKLASGELYLRFGKLESIEAARQMVAERPKLAPRSVQATLATPLDEAVLAPDVIAITAQPEQMMWLCMAASYQTGRRFDFKVSGYNAQCVETTLLPYTSGEINISLGCYGCRASSDVGDDLMFMGVPRDRMPQLIAGLRELEKKAIPDSRAKIYLPPQE
jgi:uncharacterized protein (DUF169 family)/NAD-dependent dihydropyrimidine dehydrogenase PreA subunit